MSLGGREGYLCHGEELAHAVPQPRGAQGTGPCQAALPASTAGLGVRVLLTACTEGWDTHWDDNNNK